MSYEYEDLYNDAELKRLEKMVTNIFFNFGYQQIEMYLIMFLGTNKQMIYIKYI